ncbi:hypothetical protein [Lachnoclostridium phytofermentans]|uniref:Uncharacterized protein n=1 Tax=Lachnoclostridium phytofermentans (strain ATCC 700394 / DSM 18823 / ISDg) TaxID=357809 RepID=A9KS89_LACP7|nr:hypothetical protein [Lachnoclostridium phytofermentans]ABX42121.1 hypothetical protein Cphy_1749 [Lachnoclostridium phytofermentans ISDg]
MYGDYKLVNTVYGNYRLVETKEVSRKLVTDAYDAEFDIVVKNASGTLVYTSKIQNNAELSIPQLTPGKYTVILSGNDIGQQTKYVDVVSSKTTDVNLGETLTVIGKQVNKYLDNIKTDITLADAKTDNKLEDVKVDNKLMDVREDNKLLDVYLPVKTVPDVKLGNETDPYDIYAVRLN